MKVLLAEDSPSMMMLTSSIIRESGHEVIPAKDGIEALKRYTADSPDLVILDVEMPGHNGYEVARRIRAGKEERWVPIVFLTSFVGDDHLLEGINAGGDDYLTKPVSPIVLSAKLNAMRRISEMQNKLLDITRELSDANQRLQRSAITDPLTGCFNRLFLDECLLDEWMTALHDQKPLSILVIDVDNFKTLNDTNGHYAGDHCLIRIVQLFSSMLGDKDKLCRFGGDEFVIVMPDTSEDQALATGEKIRRGMHPFNEKHMLDVPVDLSVSIGCASCVPSDDLQVQDFLKMADQALYDAKYAGRNKLVSADFSQGVHYFLGKNCENRTLLPL